MVMLVSDEFKDGGAVISWLERTIVAGGCRLVRF